MKDWKNANSLFQRRLPCCRRPRVLRSLISAREQKKQPRISFVESRIAVSMFFVYQLFCWLLITKTLTPGKGILGISRNLTEVWCGIRENAKYLDGIRDLSTTILGIGNSPKSWHHEMRCWGWGVGGKKNGVRYLSDISSRFRIVVKKEQECAIRNPPSGPCKRASAAQQETKSVVYVYARVAVWYKINIHSNHFSHTMRSLVLVWSRCEVNAFLTLLLSSKTSRKS